jgi:hypothetical protein
MKTFMISSLVQHIITTPFCGIFVRWRAHYDPKVVHLEKTHDKEEKKVSNVFQMMARVYRVEVCV